MGLFRWLFGVKKQGRQRVAEKERGSGPFRDAVGELVSPDEIDGLVGSEFRFGFEFKVLSGTNDAFLRLLLWLPYGYQLGFYDQYLFNSGGEDDPGAFVTITRRQNAYIYMTGNHGWSSKWVFQSPEVLAAWMVLNLKPAGARPSPLRKIDVRPLSSPPWDGW